MIMKKAYGIILLALLFPAYTGSAGAEGDRPVAAPEKALSSYPELMNLPVPERICEVPPFYLDYLRRSDGIAGYANYTPTAAERKLFAAYYDLLPDPLKRNLSERLACVFFIDNFAGGGMTDFCRDSKGELYLVMLFNPKTLKLSLKDWIAYRDGSTFSADGGYSVSNDLPDSYRGILHTLTHESYHAYDYIHKVTPYVEKAVSDGNRKLTPFVKGVWRSYSVPNSEYDFPSRTRVSAYGFGKKLNSAEIPSIYKSLSATPFASLYGTSCWAEDFAETCAWNYLRGKYSIVYRVNILFGGEKKGTFSPADKSDSMNRFQNLRFE
jgi:hypothetical protein